ncbi:MAG TPA: hypothetical protein VFQ23_21460, partial [Anaerolineales bacterium]|nr:hypothetical protein [Anaerolineales bacterium]
MNQAQNASRSFWLTILIFTFMVNLTMLRLTYLRLIEIGANLPRATWSGMLVICVAVMLICLWLIFSIVRSDTLPFSLISRLSHVKFDNLLWRVLGILLFLGILILIPYIKFRFELGQAVKETTRDPILVLYLYYWLCWWALLLGMWALKVGFGTTWQIGFASALILLGVAYEILIRFNLVTSYPLSLGWSEGSRYYYASLYFSNWIYGESFPLSTLHPTRYLLQSVPFLIPDLGLFAHRFWQFFLWIGLTAAGALAIAKRAFSSQEKYGQWLTAGWLFLFLLRVGVYYHLEVMVILPLLFVSAKHPWRSLIAVIAASLWAGISRVNWFPMPAMIAIALYLLETPFASVINNHSFKGIVKYLSQPV